MDRKKGLFRLNEFASYKGGDTCIYNEYIYEYAPIGYDYISNPWGWVAQHRIIGEDIIGRRLVQSKDTKIAECVHHKNECRTDNSLQNLEVMTMSEHRQHHAKGVAERTKIPVDEERLVELLKTMGIKPAAKVLGIHGQTIRNRFPHLIAHMKRKSPHLATDEKTADLIRDFAQSEKYGLADTRKILKMTENTILKACKIWGIVWVHKTRSGRPRATRG